MKTQLITRRRALIAGAAGIGGLVLPRYWNDLPPTYGHILRMGDTLTYAAHRTLLPNQSLVREYSRSQITSFPATGTTNPGAVERPLSDEYRQVQKGGFTDWRLSIEGQVARPQALTLADLKRLPARTQITRHTCEEGWSAIGEWTGVPLSQVLDAAGILPTARYVVFYSFDDWIDCIDLFDALHPQTILAYGMNGGDLPMGHGAPIRLRVERQLGYKHAKFVMRVEAVSGLERIGRGRGGYWEDKGDYEWYAGI
jgi:DMSO/TMAO reductase YedYZ molybdopterin-dependent catalytic subunit